MSATEPATVVLVHGAWHGAWCWRDVVAGLEGRGVPVVAVDLPGHGDHPGPHANLHGDAAEVRAAIDGASGPVVLVGHSYGGAVITEAGAHPAVAHLVYLAAFLLAEGESAAAAATEEAEAAGIDHSGRPDLVAAIDFESDPDPELVTIRPEHAGPVFYNDVSPDDTAWALERLGPQRLENLQSMPAAFAWHDRPSTYVVCTDDMAIHPDLQRVLARRATTSVEWVSGHSPFFSCPDALVDLLADLATELAADSTPEPA